MCIHLLNRRAGLLAVVLLTAIAASSAAEERAFYPYRAHIHVGDYEKAAQALGRSADQPLRDGEERWVLLVDRARVIRLAGDAGKAQRALDRLTPEQAREPYARLEQARLHLLSDEDADRVAGRAELARLVHEATPLPAHGANYGLAVVDFDQEQYRACIARCDQVINGIRKLELYAVPDASELRYVLSEARRLRERARLALLAEELGDHYVHYRRGRHAQARGAFEDAIASYARVEADILRDAAACYTAQCAAGLGLVDEAARLGQRFIDEDADGLYRGEAMLDLARLELIHARSKGQLEAARDRLAEALAWHQRVAQAAPPASVASIQNILARFPPPSRLTRRDNFGNYHRNHASSDTVLNRLTSTWYLQELHVHTALLHGFALNELGDRKAAMAAFEEAVELNEAYGGHIIDLGSLPKGFLADARDGALIIPPAAWRACSPEYAVRLHLGFLYLAINDTSRAEAFFDAVLDGRPAASEHDRAAAVIGRACTAFASGKSDAALGPLREFDTRYAESSLRPLANLFAANILSGQRDEAAGQAGKSALADRAWLSMAVAAYNHGRWEVAADTARRAGRSRSAGVRVSAQSVARLAQQRADDDASAARAGGRREAGRVVEVSRHFVYPGELDLRYDMSTLEPGDLLNYSIGFSIRAGCTISNFRQTTTIMEPQAPPVDESPLRFIRAPALLGT